MDAKAAEAVLVPPFEIDETIRNLAETPYPILLSGPTGSGKTTLARYIHTVSPRAKRPLVECALTSISDELRHAELAGYAKGAFTGAYTNHPGLFEAAHEGTLFLDELGHASIPLQQTLLAVIETGKIRRVGEVVIRTVDVRIICATSTDLAERCRSGEFLEELFYRVDCLRVSLAPLRECRHRILPLAVRYLQEAFIELGRDFVPVLSSETAVILRNAPWPGNMRQLRSICQYIASRLRSPRPIQPTDLPKSLHDGDNMHSTRRNHALEILARVHGNKSEAARLMRISRPSFYKLIGEAPPGSSDA